MQRRLLSTAAEARISEVSEGAGDDGSESDDTEEHSLRWSLDDFNFDLDEFTNYTQRRAASVVAVKLKRSCKKDGKKTRELCKSVEGHALFLVSCKQ